MMRNVFLLLFWLMTNVALNAQETGYRDIPILIREQKFDEAFKAIDQAIKNKKIEVGELYREAIYRPLFWDPDLRKGLRELLSQYPEEGFLSIVGQKEEGEKIRVSGVILDQEERAVAGAVFYFFAVDAEGLYAPEFRKPGYGSNNPRLFGYVKTDEGGRFEFETIRPPSYIGIRNIRHVHYSIRTQEGKRKEGEFIFSRDPEPTERQRKWAERVGFQIVEEKMGENGYECELVIFI